MLRDTKNGGRPMDDGREPARPPAEQADAAGGFEIPTSSSRWSGLIADAVSDQNGRPWVKIGDAERGRWFAVAGMVGDTRDLFRDLADAGLPILLKPDQTMLLKAVQHHRRYRQGLVAARPGWLAAPDGTRLYVHGDGTVTRPGDSQPTEVIVAFKPLAKFKPRGDLAAWQDPIGPIVAGQTLAMFMLYFGLVPPFLDLAPADYNNQVLELKGLSGCGKSTLTLLAASEWAGDPSRETLGGESWLTTLEHIEDHMRPHADSLLVLDETNKAGEDARSQGELVKKAVFRLSGTEGKARRGTGVEMTGVRLMTAISSNDGLTELGTRMGQNTKGAVAARMVTLEVTFDGPLRALDRVPPGFSRIRDAIQALHTGFTSHYGAPARALVARLVEERAADEPRLRRRIKRLLERFNESTGAGELTGGEARASKLFALAYVAGCLARKWGILPKAWGKPSIIVHRVYAVWRSTDDGMSGAAQRLWSVLEKSRPHWRDAASVKKPLKPDAFGAAAGFLVADGKKRLLLVPAPALQKALPGWSATLREMRAAGVLEGEQGKQRKLTVKAPRSLSADRERVYRIRLDKLKALISRRH